MADLGAIAKSVVISDSTSFVFPEVTTRALTITSEPKLQSPAGTLKVVGGTMRLEGVLTANRVIRIYNHADGAFLYETTSDSLGHWSCPSLNATKIMAVAIGDNTYNAQVYDMVVPD